LFINDDVLYNGIKFCHEDQLDIAAIFLEQSFQNNSKNIVTIYYIATLKFKLKEYQVAANLFHEVIEYIKNLTPSFIGCFPHNMHTIKRPRGSGFCMKQAEKSCKRYKRSMMTLLIYQNIILSTKLVQEKVTNPILVLLLRK